MGIKTIHTVIIFMSILLTSFFSYSMYISDNNNSVLLSIGSAAVTILLLYYLASILKKFKTIS